MKALPILSRYSIKLIYLLVFLSSNVYSQKLSHSTWEGYFMKDFKTIIAVTGSDEKPEGTIRMFSGDQLIQNDKLTKILSNGDSIRFFIEAKETLFEGSLSNNKTELSGVFIFPDGSEHPFSAKVPGRSGADNFNSDAQIEIMLDREYPPEDLGTDLDCYVQLLKDKYPGFYKNIPEDTFNEVYQNAKEKIFEPMRVEKFFPIIAPFVAKIGCSHTGVRLPEAVRENIRKKGNYFPVEVCVLKDKIYALSNHSIDSITLAKGSEIISINGIPTAQIIHQLLALIPSESGIRTTAYNELNRQFYTWYYMVDNSSEFLLEFQKGTNVESIRLPACRFIELTKKQVNEETANQYAFHYDKEMKTGFLRISTFGIDGMDAYLIFLDSIFNTLQHEKASNLVLDLRDNAGGHPIFAAQLISYLTDREFTYFKPNPDVEEFEPLYHPMQPAEKHFTGQLYVFINGGCLSTTGHFISLSEYYTNAVFIGETPGSTYSCNDFSFQTSLPNTGLEVTIPRTSFETAVPEEKRKIPFTVDYEVTETVNDLISGTDTYYELLYTSLLK